MQRTATTLPYTELEVADGNFDTSRSTIDRVIIHTMVGSWQAAAARFDNPTSVVSAHYGVKLDGTLIHWLEEFNTAYHSGDYSMNQRSIGIEHEDGGDYNGVRPDVLYTESAKLVRDICQFYNIPIDRQHILKHSEVIATGCPDALDIDRIVKLAAGNTPQTMTIDSDTFARMRGKCDKYDAFVIAGYNSIDDVNTKVTNFTAELQQANDTIARLQAIPAPTLPQTPPITDPSVLQGQINNLLKVHQAIRAVVYDKWSIIPGTRYWYGTQLHRLKYIFEKGI